MIPYTITPITFLQHKRLFHLSVKTSVILTFVIVYVVKYFSQLTLGKWHVTNIIMIIAMIRMVLFLVLPLGIYLMRVIKVLIRINIGKTTMINPDPIKL